MQNRIEVDRLQRPSAFQITLLVPDQKLWGAVILLDQMGIGFNGAETESNGSCLQKSVKAVVPTIWWGILTNALRPCISSLWL